jgi:hypothetical protein
MRSRDKIIHTIETKGLLNHAIREGGSIAEPAVIVTNNVIGMSITWPPTHQPCGRLNASVRCCEAHREQKCK